MQPPASRAGVIRHLLSPPGERGLRLHAHRVAAVWFVVWFAVGLVVLGAGLTVPLGGWSDFLFNALAAALVLLAVARAWGAVRALAAFLIVATVSAFVEGLGARTGFLFGSYHYTDNFGPLIAGIVPWAVPLAWWTIVVGVLQMTVLFTRALPAWSRWVCIPAYAAAAAVLTDLPLETLAYQVREYWIWRGDGPWYGVPLTNFTGWAMLTALLSLPVLAIGGEDLDRSWSRLGPWPLLALLGTHLSFAAGNLGNGFTLPGLLALVNAFLVLLALRRLTTGSPEILPG